MNGRRVLLLSTFLWLLAAQCMGAHLRGTWKTSSFFKFVSKFAFQRTNRHDPLNTQGYVFGNVTTNAGDSDNLAAFVVVDRRYFDDFHASSSISQRDDACKAMFRRIDGIAYDSNCNIKGSEDFIRKIPCPSNATCVDEDQPDRVVQGYQLTYAVQDINQPRFWYISMVACKRVGTSNKSCSWVHDPTVDIEVEYDIWLVNGNPYTRHQNPFEYQFSFDKQDIVELYLAFLVLLLVLLSVQIFAAIRQRHPIARLFTVTIAVALLGTLLHFAHVMKYAMDGEGVDGLGVMGDICDILATTLFILVLLLLAKGWAVSHAELSRKLLLFFLWSAYLLTNILLCIWNRAAMDVIYDVDEFKTWPGWLSLGVRILVMIWFLYEVRGTMCRELNRQKLQFFLHFGASSLVWFISLPVVALVSINVSALWRFKLLLGTSYLANFFAFCSVAHLLWPTRSEQYLHLTGTESDAGDELEEFNEAPHVLNQKAARV